MVSGYGDLCFKDKMMLILNSGWHWQVDWKPIIIFLIVLAIVAYVLAFPLLIATAAKKRGRSGFLWFVFSLVVSPILAILILLALGDTDEKRREKLMYEELLRCNVRTYHSVNNANNHTNSENERLRMLLEQSQRL